MNHNNEERLTKVSGLFNELILSCGENINRNGLKNTPQRAAKAFSFLTQGYSQSIEDIVNNALFDTDNEEMVIVKDIELFSLCEHHLLPIIGRCHVGYLPDGKVLGLSKVARIVDMYARRLQIQENLTLQIANGIQEVTKARGVVVIIEATHLCMVMRGVEKQHPTAATIAKTGVFKTDYTTYQEFLDNVKIGRFK